jgi:hypothetical protein
MKSISVTTYVLMKSISVTTYVLMKSISVTTYVLMKSMDCALSWSALCKSARINMSAAFSIDRFVHSASSHMTFNLSSAYCNTHTHTVNVLTSSKFLMTTTHKS